MKNLLTVIFVLFVIVVYGQETAPEKSVERKWAVKVMPVNYMLQNIPFEVERMLNGKNSVILGLGIPRSSSMIGRYGIEAKSDGLSALDAKTMYIRTAYRHYTGKSALPKGFYIEPYLKYQKVNANATAAFTNDQNDVQYPAELKSDFHTFNAGFQLGYQFLIVKRVAIDFYFFGLEGGILNGNFTGSSDNTSDISDLRSKIEDGINDLPGFLKNKLEVTSTNNSVNVKAKSIPYPWYRGGISVGIAF